LEPAEQFEELRVQGRFAAGELKDFNFAFAIDNTLDALLEIFERDGVNFLAGAERGVREARWTTEVAGTDDFDEREAGGKLFHNAERVPGVGVATERADVGAICGATGIRAAAARVFGLSFCEPIEARVGSDAGCGFAMFRARAFEEDLGRDAA